MNNLTETEKSEMTGEVPTNVLRAVRLAKKVGKDVDEKSRRTSLLSAFRLFRNHSKRRIGKLNGVCICNIGPVEESLFWLEFFNASVSYHFGFLGIWFAWEHYASSLADPMNAAVVNRLRKRWGPELDKSHARMTNTLARAINAIIDLDESSIPTAKKDELVTMLQDFDDQITLTWNAADERKLVHQYETFRTTASLLRPKLHRISTWIRRGAAMPLQASAIPNDKEILPPLSPEQRQQAQLKYMFALECKKMEVQNRNVTQQYSGLGNTAITHDEIIELAKTKSLQELKDYWGELSNRFSEPFITKARQLIPDYDRSEPAHSAKLAAILCQRCNLRPADYWSSTPKQLEQFLDIAVAMQGKDAIPISPQPNSVVRPDPTAQAAALVIKHPQWSIRKMAKEIGCAHSTLSRSSLFKRARALAQGKIQPPSGTKDADGNIDAVDDRQGDEE